MKGLLVNLFQQLSQVTREIHDAAMAGDLERVNLLLGDRQQVMEHIQQARQGKGKPLPADLQSLLQGCAEVSQATETLLADWRQHVEAELKGLQQRRRALVAYTNALLQPEIAAGDLS